MQLTPVQYTTEVIELRGAGGGGRHNGCCGKGGPRQRHAEGIVKLFGLGWCWQDWSLGLMVQRTNGIVSRTLIKRLRCGPRVIVTDKLASYQVAHRKLLPSVTHRRSKYLNNRAENSHQPTRIRERMMKRFASPGQAQRFLFAFSHIRQHFRPRRHLISAPQWRTEMTNRVAVWGEITVAPAA